jgi:PBP1b-binding outer membrane lipoprotein LpoB
MKKLMLITILALLIVGCTPDESAESLPPVQNTAESAVNPVEEPGEEQSLDPNAPIDGTGVLTNTDVTLVAPSGSVDLDELDPDAATDEEAGEIEQPAPGIPDPEVKMVQLTAEALAERLDIDISEVTLVESLAQDWPDAGLGCPAPDAIYAAVITPGFQITLEAQGENFIYHTDTAETVVLCIDGLPAE